MKSVSLQESYELQKETEQNQAVTNIKRNPKLFFSYCKKFAKTHTQIGPLKKADGKVTSDPGTAQCVNCCGNNTAMHSPHSKISTTAGRNSYPAQPIRQLRPNSAAGPDSVPAIVLIKCCDVLPALAKIIGHRCDFKNIQTGHHLSYLQRWR